MKHVGCPFRSDEQLALVSALLDNDIFGKSATFGYKTVIDMK
jgi:hypothetical protein